MVDLSVNAFTILALGVYILIAKRATSRENAPGVSAWLRICLGIFFVCVALSTASALSVLIAAALGRFPGYIFGVGISLSALHSWLVASSFLLGNLFTVFIFHRIMYWYFGYLSGAPLRGSFGKAGWHQ